MSHYSIYKRNSTENAWLSYMLTGSSGSWIAVSYAAIETSNFWSFWHSCCFPSSSSGIGLSQGSWHLHCILLPLWWAFLKYRFLFLISWMILLFSQGKFYSVWQYSPRDALLQRWLSHVQETPKQGCGKPETCKLTSPQSKRILESGEIPQ